MKCISRQHNYRIYRAGPIEGLRRLEGNDYGVYAPGTSPWDDDAPAFVADGLAACEEWVDECVHEGADEACVPGAARERRVAV